MEDSNPPTVDSTKSLVLPIKLIGHIKAAIYIARAASPKRVSYFRFYLLYCAQMTKPHIADPHISMDAEVERRW